MSDPVNYGDEDGAQNAAESAAVQLFAALANESSAKIISNLQPDKIKLCWAAARLIVGITGIRSPCLQPSVANSRGRIACLQYGMLPLRVDLDEAK
jgi:hypothetical protein